MLTSHATPITAPTGLAGNARLPEEERDGLEPWTLLPIQAAERAGTARQSGEKRLMAAVLADAIQLLMKHAQSRTASGRILFRETERWIESPDRRWLLSFENVCDVLGIDASRLRAALRRQVASGGRLSIPFDAGRLRVARRRKVRV